MTQEITEKRKYLFTCFALYRVTQNKKEKTDVRKQDSIES